jgi:hypothetical protein
MVAHVEESAAKSVATMSGQLGQKPPQEAFDESHGRPEGSRGKTVYFFGARQGD